MNENCMCCLTNSINNLINFLANQPKVDLCKIESALCGMNDLLATIANNQTTLISQGGHQMMTISGNYSRIDAALIGGYNYPERVSYATQQLIKITENSPSNLVFIDMLNPNIYVMFKQPLDADLPVYFRDGSYNGKPDGFMHDVVDLGGNPILSNKLENNKVYEAEYRGNQIILNI